MQDPDEFERATQEATQQPRAETTQASQEPRESSQEAHSKATQASQQPHADSAQAAPQEPRAESAQPSPQNESEKKTPISRIGDRFVWNADHPIEQNIGNLFACFRQRRREEIKADSSSMVNSTINIESIIPENCSRAEHRAMCNVLNDPTCRSRVDEMIARALGQRLAERKFDEKTGYHPVLIFYDVADVLTLDGSYDETWLLPIAAIEYLLAVLALDQFLAYWKKTRERKEYSRAPIAIVLHRPDTGGSFSFLGMFVPPNKVAEVVRKNGSFVQSQYFQLRMSSDVPNMSNVCVYKCVKHASRCSGCQQVWYCSTACQKRHWPTHKNDCQSHIAKRLQLEREQKEKDEQTADRLRRQIEMAATDKPPLTDIPIAPSKPKIKTRKEQHIPMTIEQKQPVEILDDCLDDSIMNSAVTRGFATGRHSIRHMLGSPRHPAGPPGSKLGLKLDDTQIEGESPHLKVLVSKK